jgi:DNA-binding NarL/FixJ family response regulator
VGEAADGLAAVEAADATRPDIVIADYSLPNMNGADLTRRIKQSLPDTEVLIFTMHDAEDVVRDSLGAGAIGFLTKADGSRQLLAAVEALIHHQPYFTAKVNETLLASFLNPGKPGTKSSVLTPRERQVVTLIAEGKSCREAAEVLGISAKTAETHRATAMQKLGVTSSAALIRYAFRNRLVQA